MQVSKSKGSAFNLQLFTFNFLPFTFTFTFKPSKYNPMKLVTVPQMREIEKQADANGLTYAEMMENAGRGLAEIVNEIAFDEDWDETLGLVGPGNNGGDTLIALTHLAEEGWHACAYIIKRSQKDDLITRLLEAGGEVVFAEDDTDFSALAAHLETAEILLDGLLGTGIKLPLKQEISTLLEQTLFILEDLDEPPYIIAVDCPSGVDCDTGEAAIECHPRRPHRQHGGGQTRSAEIARL